MRDFCWWVILFWNKNLSFYSCQCGAWWFNFNLFSYEKLRVNGSWRQGVWPETQQTPICSPKSVIYMVLINLSVNSRWQSSLPEEIESSGDLTPNLSLINPWKTNFHYYYFSQLKRCHSLHTITVQIFNISFIWH